MPVRGIGAVGYTLEPGRSGGRGGKGPELLRDLGWRRDRVGWRSRVVHTFRGDVPGPLPGTDAAHGPRHLRDVLEVELADTRRTCRSRPLRSEGDRSRAPHPFHRPVEPEDPRQPGRPRRADAPEPAPCGALDPHALDTGRNAHRREHPGDRRLHRQGDRGRGEALGALCLQQPGRRQVPPPRPPLGVRGRGTPERGGPQALRGGGAQVRGRPRNRTCHGTNPSSNVLEIPLR